MRLLVFVNGRLTITESNLRYALPYWMERKRLREKDGVRITWEVQA